MSRIHRSQDIWKGAVAGLVGGIVGSWVMNQFQLGWTKLSRSEQTEQKQKQQPETDEDATMRMANRLLRPIIGRELTHREKKIGGPIVHYTFGGSMGALYGTLAEVSPMIRWGAGTGFGSALFVAADEIAVPLARLSGSPKDTPLNLHLYAWASHIVYGLATETTRLGVRAILGDESRDHARDRRPSFARNLENRKRQSARQERRAA
ncbi:MAG TPA: DUF1440 domain-containing protein [Terriglobales bacterium]